MSAPARYRRLAFFDFDGTITAEDTFVGAMRRFVPAKAGELMPRIVSGQTTLRAALRELLESFPSDRYAEMISSIAAVPLRAGLPELLDTLDPHGCGAVVVSSGLTDMVRGRLGELAARFIGIHAIDADPAGTTLRIHSDFEAGDEMVAKAEVVRHYAERFGVDETIGMGDAITDRHLAKAVSVVFARDKLVRYCEEAGVPYVPWNDFHDVRAEVDRRWGG